MADQYQKLGASASKAGLHKTLAAAGLDASSELFAATIADLSGDPEYASFLHADGAGTKSIVAYLHYKETGDPNCFAGLAQDALVMNLDDIYCIGRPECLVLSNTIGRNSKLIDDSIIGVLVNRYKQLAAELKQLGIAVTLGGGETADCGDVVRTLMVDATVAGRIAKKNLVRAGNIQAGDVIVGLSSTGQAAYETTANSGIGSNGLTLARHCMLHSVYRKRFPECCDPGLDQTIAYRGPFRTTDRPEGLGMSVGEALSSPTRTYAPVLNEIYQTLGSEIHGVIHNTGGGQTKVLRFGKSKKFIKDALFPAPPVFQLIQQHGSVPWKEMYQVFNMGHRMEVYLPVSLADQVIQISKKYRIEAKIIGRVEPGPGGPEAANTMLLKSEHGEFSYLPQLP